MSWIVRRPRGQKWLGFRRHGKQYTVRLGKSDEKTVERALVLLDRLIACVDQGLDPDPELRAWLDRMADGPRRSIATAGLAPPRVVRTVGSLCRRYVEGLDDRAEAKRLKPSTVTNAVVVAGNLVRHFGEDRPLDSIEPEDCERFRTWLRREGRAGHARPLAETTVSRQCRRAREVFGLAIAAGWLTRNPWAPMKGFRERDPSRDAYVPRELVQRVIDATGDAEVRFVLAVARFCGVRGPSEVQSLLLDDIDFQRRTIRFATPKLEHLEGHADRLCPLWPEVEPHARALFNRPVIHTSALPNLSRFTDAGIAGRVKRAVVDAGVEPWPKLFVNMRASCERDLLQRGHAIDDVCAWLGHSPSVALKHYNRAARVIAAESATQPPRGRLGRGDGADYQRAV
ncbi:tyrosine-type recombinase/integrase [Botrimarina mediterranea]|uniref:tyrosine-type recombinase/integrase n=1 Tax=Botrimarina mediterranea TaxID=2528022 RepID=UPI0011894CCB|nr:Phage integrase family protein [Planctomycetes bacterium K2D]